MRRFLDGLYWGSGVLACVFMVGIAVMIVAQILGRITGILVPSADDISGYFMGASTFFALAHALQASDTENLARPQIDTCAIKCARHRE